MKNQTIGIEIEMTGLTRTAAAKVVAEHLGVQIQRTFGTYDTHKMQAADGRTWTIVRDASIRQKKRINGTLQDAGDEYKVELVSPILTYSDIPDLQEIVRKLKKAGAVNNTSELSCGIHVHIGKGKHTPNTLKNLVNLMASKEELIYKSLGIQQARADRWCKKIDERLITNLAQKKPKTMEALADIWYTGYDYDRNAHYNDSRYHGLNLHATFTKGTIEFRLFNGTLHAGEIRSYIVFCLALSHQALSQKNARANRTVTTNDKYTFRCWLLRLGLSGDEYKNCRHHLMAKLSGNSAWKTPSRAVA